MPPKMCESSMAAAGLFEQPGFFWGVGGYSSGGLVAFGAERRVDERRAESRWRSCWVDGRAAESHALFSPTLGAYISPQHQMH